MISGNIIFGVITLLLSSFLFIYSWRFKTRNNFKIAVLLLLLGGLILRIYTSADFYLHTWDERYHALVAKNMIQHPLTPTFIHQ